MSKTLKVDANQLADAVAWITKAKHRSSIPVLNTVQVSAVLGALQLRRTDYELFRECLVPAEGGDQASVHVDPAKLAGMFKGRQVGTALVEVSDTELSVGLGGRTVKLRGNTVEADDFPAWPPFIPNDNEKRAAVSAPKLARALTSVGTDPKLPMLAGVRFEDGMMVTINSARTRVTRIRYASEGFTTLVPPEAVQAFARGTDLVYVEVGTTPDKAVAGALVRLSCGGRSIIARALDADFPKWRHLVPVDQWMPVIALIRRDELLNAIGTDGGSVDITFTANSATMTVRVADRDGDMEVEQEVGARLMRGDNLPFTVRLATKNLAAGLKGIGAGALRIMAIHPHKPVMLWGIGDDDLHLLMPVKMPDTNELDKPSHYTE